MGNIGVAVTPLDILTSGSNALQISRAAGKSCAIWVLARLPSLIIVFFLLAHEHNEH